MKSPLITSIAVLVLASPIFAEDAKPAEKPHASVGYTDTPIIPGTKWHVHDSERPQPPVVTPGDVPAVEKTTKTFTMVTGTSGAPGGVKTTTSSTTTVTSTVATAPSDATVLFDGTDLSKWKMEKDGSDAKWKVEDGYFEVVPKSGYMETREEFGPDFQLHVEFATPNPPVGDSQGRSNSGVFLFGRYEIQVLDSYQNRTYADGGATAIYGYMPPQVNASRPPGQWQTYDIICEGPRFKDGKLEKPLIVTVLHNGVVTQNHTALIGETPHKQVGTYHAHPEQGPLKLQDHGNPIRYRNIWIRALHMPTPEDIGDGPKIGQ